MGGPKTQRVHIWTFFYQNGLPAGAPPLSSHTAVAAADNCRRCRQKTGLLLTEAEGSFSICALSRGAAGEGRGVNAMCVELGPAD